MASVRAPFIDGINWQSGPTESKKEECQSQQSVPKKSPSGSSQNQATRSQHVIEDLSSSAVLQAACEDGSTLEIDAALATVPFGHKSAKVAYWIHPDNIVQIHVLLLQYTRLQKANGTIASPECPSSPRGSIGDHPAKCSSRTDEEVGVIICDDLERFAQRQSSETVSDAETRAGLASEKAAASIKYSPNGDAIIVVSAATKENGKSVGSGRKLPIWKARVKRKAIQRLFSPSRDDRCAIADNATDYERISEWLTRHKEVQPLVQLQFRRTRFVGLQKSATTGLWATLDKDISMRSCSAELLAGDKGFERVSGGEKDSESFPHAVLEIRSEGLVDTDLISALDASYLVRLLNLNYSLSLKISCRQKGYGAFLWRNTP